MMQDFLTPDEKGELISLAGDIERFLANPTLKKWRMLHRFSLTQGIFKSDINTADGLEEVKKMYAIDACLSFVFHNLGTAMQQGKTLLEIQSKGEKKNAPKPRRRGA